MEEEQKFSVWKRVFTLEPHDTEWQEFIIADDADEIMGTIKVMESPPGSKTCWIENIHVNREHRRKGWGTKLLELAIHYARTRNCRYISGQVKPHDDLQVTNLSDFYQKNGFTITRQEDAFHPVIMMRLG